MPRVLRWSWGGGALSFKKGAPVGLLCEGFKSAAILWVGHRPGQARLWVGVGAIGAFGSISGSVSSDEYTDQLQHAAHMPTGHAGPGSPQTPRTGGSAA